MNELLISVKREYWEYRSVVVGLPLILALLAFIAAIGVEMFQDRVTHNGVAELIENVTNQELTDEERKELRKELAESDIEFNSDPGNAFEPMAWFIGVSWLASFYYLLGCLYNDRKDKSILFFKSLPISEQFNVLSKLGFGTLCVTGIAIAVGWGSAFILMLFGLGDHQNQGLSLATLSAYFIAPFQAVIVGLLWGAPIFAYLAFASAAAKRSPFLLAIVPIVVLSFLEAVVFKDVEILSFFFSHMPFAVTAFMTEESTHGAFKAFVIDRGQSMLLGLVVAALFIAAAIWHRNNKFEI